LPSAAAAAAISAGTEDASTAGPGADGAGAGVSDLFQPESPDTDDASGLFAAITGIVDSMVPTSISANSFFIVIPPSFI